MTNVERAIANLRSAGVLTVEGIRKLPLTKLEELIRSSGYFRQKSQRLKNFVTFLDQRYGGSLERMFATPSKQLRTELLTQNGIGPETADAILLYAGHHEIFVVDAYTRRILGRHQAVTAGAKYDEIRTLIERALQHEQPAELHGSSRKARPQIYEVSAMSAAQRTPLAQVYNEMHGLLVQVGKHYCLKQQPRCEVCPLGSVQPIWIEEGATRRGKTNRRPSARTDVLGRDDNSSHGHTWKVFNSWRYARARRMVSSSAALALAYSSGLISPADGQSQAERALPSLLPAAARCDREPARPAPCSRRNPRLLRRHQLCCDPMLPPQQCAGRPLDFETTYAPPITSTSANAPRM